MRRLDHVLSRVAERGDPLGADLLIDHLERKLAGEPDPIVVARQRSGVMRTVNERTTQQPGSPTRRKGLAVALASFVVALVAGGGILLWAALDDNGGGEAAVPATTAVAPSTTLPPSGAVEAVGTFTFDGTTWSYDGPSTLEAGPVTFSLVNTSTEQVSVISFYELTPAQIEAELAVAAIGTDFAAGTPPPPESDFMDLAKAVPGESASWVVTMPAGTHLIDGATIASSGEAEHIWRLAVFEVVEPTTVDAVGTFTFDGTTWSYDGPTTIEAGPATFSLVNTSSEPVAVISWFGMTGEELDAELAVVPVGTDMAVTADTPTPPSSFVFLGTAAPGQSVSTTTVLGLGSHVIDAGTTTSGAADHVWRLAVIKVTEPASMSAGEAVGTFTFDGTTWSYDGPSTLEPGPVTFSLVNTSTERVGVFSWFGLSGEELDADLAVTPVGTDIGDSSDAPPPPPSDFMLLVGAAPGESASATTVMGAGTHLIDCATLAGPLDATHLWRVAMIEVN